MGVTIQDTELLIQFRDPDTKEKAFTAIIKKYQEKLYWHIRRMVVEHEDANDVLQNVFIRVWNGLENFREDSQLYTWLYRIATNECLSYLEQQKKKATLSLDDGESNLSNKIIADNRQCFRGICPRRLVQDRAGVADQTLIDEDKCPG